ncbi:glycosyltransferase [Frigidibacter sp. ROC022]|uniref:glycosyltransferase n=1 Tax=Frigidibacter sp. ROC022 TaxID=2971796 RepID=UPI00215A72CE|nr:glycosyltransferase family A protein [Frigidibacter sp. ROC022]MCR8726788.1 glycosyltransferase family 2 protein [Frigidibacter sp. ROC022]
MATDENDRPRPQLEHSENPHVSDVVSEPSASDPLSGLTVIIPHLNGPEGLARCLAALARERAEAAPDMKVIVVDNGSSVLPHRVCEAYPFVRLIEETEPGPGPARSHGARLAQTGIIAFIDADCTVRPGWAAAMLDHLRSHPETSVVGGDVYIAMTDPERPTAIEAYESVYGYRMRQYVERHNYTGTGNMAVRREAFEKVGDFAGISVAEDMDWGRRATALGLKIDFVPGMDIETPARDSFAELARKWDRHIAHAFAVLQGPKGKVLWVLRALALAVSPPVEAIRILRTDRVTGLRTRGMTLLVLTRLRLYRARRMLGMLVGSGQSSKTAWRGD